MVDDLEHNWYFNCGRCSTPPYLVAIIVIIPWHIWRNWFGSLNVCVTCLISVVARKMFGCLTCHSVARQGC